MFHLLTSVILVSSGVVGTFPGGPEHGNATEIDIEQIARLYRIQVYRSLRTEREEFDRRRSIGQQVLRAWEDTGRRDPHHADASNWFRAAIFATTPGHVTALPEIPHFAATSSASHAKQFSKSRSKSLPTDVLPNDEDHYPTDEARGPHDTRQNSSVNGSLDDKSEPTHESNGEPRVPTTRSEAENNESSQDYRIMRGMGRALIRSLSPESNVEESQADQQHRLQNDNNGSEDGHYPNSNFEDDVTTGPGQSRWSQSDSDKTTTGEDNSVELISPE